LLFKDKWKIATILFLLFVINLYIPHLTFAQTHPWMASKSEQILLADGIELPTIPSNDPIEIPKVEIPSDSIEIPKVKIPENKVEVPKAEIPKAPVQESTGFIDQLLKWLQKQLSLILALLCLGLGLFLLSTNPLVGTSIVMGMAVSGFGAWMADKDVSSIAQEALIGGIAGLIGLGAGALAFRLIGGRIATMAPPWLGKWLPFVGSGGVAGVADSASFDYMRDGKVDWKKAGLAGLLSVAIGFAGLGVAQYGGKLIGPAVVSKINDIPLTAVSVFKDGATSAPKTVGDTPFGAWLQKFASNGGSKRTSEVTKGISNIKVKFKKGYDKHLIEVEGFRAKPSIGIKGGHNLSNFEKFILDNFSDQVTDISQVIVYKTQHPKVKGIYEIKYKLPVYDGKSMANGGKGNFTGNWKVYRNPKTVYDPNIISDEQILKLGKEAMEEGIVSKRISLGKGRSPSDTVEGFAEINGEELKFIGFKDKNTDEIINFFPVIN
jgi:hypothetical protein